MTAKIPFEFIDEVAMVLKKNQGRTITITPTQRGKFVKEGQEHYKRMARGRNEDSVIENTVVGRSAELLCHDIFGGNLIHNTLNSINLEHLVLDRLCYSAIYNAAIFKNRAKGYAAKAVSFDCHRQAVEDGLNLLPGYTLYNPGYINMDSLHMIQNSKKEEIIIPDFVIVANLIKMEELKYRGLFRLVADARTFFRYRKESEKSKIAHYFYFDAIARKAGACHKFEI